MRKKQLESFLELLVKFKGKGGRPKITVLELIMPNVGQNVTWVERRGDVHAQAILTMCKIQ
jgi:hypothetical protein